MRIPLKLPPGVTRPGTRMDARGRWYDSNLVRWHDGVMRAIGGWDTFLDLNTTAPQGAHAWTINTDRRPRLAVGTATALRLIGANSNDDIAPSDLTAGNEGASYTSGGYGVGLYGVGLYGEGDVAVVSLDEANSWSLDNYGEDLVAVSLADGRLLYFDMDDDPGVTDAAALTNAPTGNIGVVVTPEEYIVALGAGADPRKIRWPDRDTITDWTPSATNTADERILPGAGAIMAGKRSAKETLIWTDTDLFAMRYVGGSFVYNVAQVGSQCGPISRRAMVVIDGQAFWMGRRGFFQYNGFTQPLPSEVGDFVFGNMNTTQVSKIWGVSNARFNEVTWFYPSAGSAVCDRYVTVNVVTGAWALGALSRSAGVDSGSWPTPLWLDETSEIFRHEIGGDHGSLTPSAESGPVVLGNGDFMMHVQEIIPDFGTTGNVQVTLKAALTIGGDEATYGPYSVTDPVPVRFVGRTVRLIIEETGAGWTFGTPALEAERGGMR